MLSLTEAWENRRKLLADAQTHLDRVAELRKATFSAPFNSKVTMWFAACSSFYEAQNAELIGNTLRYEADECWHNAVLENKGNIRLTWADVEGRGWKCTLETGEVFEP